MNYSFKIILLTLLFFSQFCLGELYNPPTATPTINRYAGWDASLNFSANNFYAGYTTTATAAGTTTMTVTSTQQQYWTGSTTQTVKLPVTSTLALGVAYIITNLSSGVVTVQSSGANTIQAMAANTQAVFTVILTSGTGTSSWNLVYYPIGTVPIASGGTGQVTKAAAFDALSPMTTGGDLIYGGASGTGTRLANGSAFNVLQSAGGTSAPTWAVHPTATGALVAAAGTVSAEVTDFINGNCTNSVGTAVCTFTTSYFSAAPTCNVTIQGDVTAGALGAITISAISTTTVTVKMSTAGVGNISRDFYLICNGLR